VDAAFAHFRPYCGDIAERMVGVGRAPELTQQPLRHVTVIVGPVPASRPLSDEVCGRKSYVTLVVEPVENERVQFGLLAVVVAEAMLSVHALEPDGFRSNQTVLPASGWPESDW